MTHEMAPATMDAEATLEPADTISRFFEALETGDYPVLLEVLTPDAITRWPQSGERITGAMACLRGVREISWRAPTYRVQRISGGGTVLVEEVLADYGDERWYVASIIEFEGTRIARMTDYFGPTLPAPDWRQEWVEREDG